MFVHFPSNVRTQVDNSAELLLLILAARCRVTAHLLLRRTVWGELGGVCRERSIAFSYCGDTIKSTRRLRCRPSSVSFSVTGAVSPYPVAVHR